jgi:hypothetical protein
MEIRKLLSKSGIRQLLSKRAERRRSPRMQPADLVAYYWTGGIPRPKPVVEIGVYGAHIVATPPFYLGTVVEIVFEDRAAALNNGAVSHHICTWGRVLRTVADGFCVEFAFEDASQRRKFRQFLGGLKRRNEDETNTEETPETNTEEPPIEQRPGTD